MSVERDMRELATKQHGVVSIAQATELGARSRWRANRLDAGTWVQRTPRVLAVAGAPDTLRTVAMTAVLDAGPGAVASHRTAAVLWQLPGFTLEQQDVTRRRTVAGRASIAFEHRPRLLLPHHLTRVAGIPTTTLPRTIFDLAGSDLSLGRLARTIDEVVTRDAAMLVALHDLLPELAARGRPGITRMRTLLDERPPGVAVAASGLERRFETILRNAGDPPLERQIDLGGQAWVGSVDYWDRAARIVVEVDSDLHHTSLVDRVHDGLRDEALREAGARAVVRVPEEHVWHQPWLVVAAVREARKRAVEAA
jgi:very-short-patch-repair endonuclease